MSELIKSYSEAKCFILCSNLLEFEKFAKCDINAMLNAINTLVTVSGKNLLDGLSIVDRKAICDLVHANANTIDDIFSEECIKKTRIEMLGYVYQKHELSEIKDRIEIELGSIKNILSSISLSNLNLSEQSLMFIKEVVFSDLCFVVAGKIARSKIEASESSIDVLNLMSEENINEIVFKKLATIIVNQIGSDLTVNIKTLLSDLEDIAGKIFSDLVRFIQNEIKTYNPGVNLSSVRDREAILNTREIELEDRDKKIQEIMKKNLEFSRELQKKSIELEAKLDQIETKKLAMEDYMEKIIDICNKVLSFTDKLKSGK